MQHIEANIQMAVVSWLRVAHPDLLFTGGCAGDKLRIPAAIRRKRLGYRSGSPDLIIFEAKGYSHGLLIEMKSKDGRQSDTQKIFGEAASFKNYAYVVCHSLEEAQQAVEKYLNQENYDKNTLP